MKILAILRPRKGGDVRAAVAARAAEELNALWRLYRGGAVREMYWPGEPGAIFVVESESLASARSILAVLPLLADEVMALEVIELRPFAALEMLFSERVPR